MTAATSAGIGLALQSDASRTSARSPVDTTSVFVQVAFLACWNAVTESYRVTVTLLPPPQPMSVGT